VSEAFGFRTAEVVFDTVSFLRAHASRDAKNEEPAQLFFEKPKMKIQNKTAILLTNKEIAFFLVPIKGYQTERELLARWIAI
jgi:hypothetical protein